MPDPGPHPLLPMAGGAGQAPSDPPPSGNVDGCTKIGRNSRRRTTDTAARRHQHPGRLMSGCDPLQQPEPAPGPPACAPGGRTARLLRRQGGSDRSAKRATPETAIDMGNVDRHARRPQEVTQQTGHALVAVDLAPDLAWAANAAPSADRNGAAQEIALHSHPVDPAHPAGRVHPELHGSAPRWTAPHHAADLSEARHDMPSPQDPRRDRTPLHPHGSAVRAHCHPPARIAAGAQWSGPAGAATSRPTSPGSHPPARVARAGPGGFRGRSGRRRPRWSPRPAARSRAGRSRPTGAPNRAPRSARVIGWCQATAARTASSRLLSQVARGSGVRAVRMAGP